MSHPKLQEYKKCETVNSLRGFWSVQKEKNIPFFYLSLLVKKTGYGATQNLTIVVPVENKQPENSQVQEIWTRQLIRGLM